MQDIITPQFIEIMSDLVPKILVATMCGLIIGYDRELKQKVAGIRTNILICVGCAILTYLSFYLSKNNPSIDPTRIIGQIITGIGFLGAGVIMKNDDKIIGVTTAAFIWIISSIGILIGAIESFSIPIILTFGLLIISRIFEKIESYIKNIKK
jgi:putative Mg2+ transporter-C (MgtC) family protein